MSFHSWYAKSIEEAHKRYEREDKEEEAARKLREQLDICQKASIIRSEKRRLKKEYDNNVDLWGI